MVSEQIQQKPLKKESLLEKMAMRCLRGTRSAKLVSTKKRLRKLNLALSLLYISDQIIIAGEELPSSLIECYKKNMVHCLSEFRDVSDKEIWLFGYLKEYLPILKEYSEKYPELCEVYKEYKQTLGEK